MSKAPSFFNEKMVYTFFFLAVSHQKYTETQARLKLSVLQRNEKGKEHGREGREWGN